MDLRYWVYMSAEFFANDVRARTYKLKMMYTSVLPLQFLYLLFSGNIRCENSCCFK